VKVALDSNVLAYAEDTNGIEMRDKPLRVREPRLIVEVAAKSAEGVYRFLPASSG
jgi:hypothetical protein